MKGVFAGVAVAALGLGFALCGSAPAADQKVSYSKDVKPIFEASCIKCHHVDDKHKKAASGFRLDDPELAMKGGDSGKSIVPGNANDSLLYKLLKGPATVKDDEVEAMPKAKKGEKWKALPADQIETIKKWIDQGAKWE